MGKGIHSILLIEPLLAIMAGCASMDQINIAQLRVIPVSEIIAEPSKLEEIGQEIQNGKEIVFHIREGQIIPLRTTMALPMVILQPGKNNFVFTRDMYLLISRSKIKISLDGQKWVDINDFKSQKTLLGFDKNSLSIGFGGTKEEGLQISIDIVAK